MFGRCGLKKSGLSSSCSEIEKGWMTWTQATNPSQLRRQHGTGEVLSRQDRCVGSPRLTFVTCTVHGTDGCLHFFTPTSKETSFGTGDVGQGATRHRTDMGHGAEDMYLEFQIVHRETLTRTISQRDCRKSESQEPWLCEPGARRAWNKNNSTATANSDNISEKHGVSWNQKNIESLCTMVLKCKFEAGSTNNEKGCSRERVIDEKTTSQRGRASASRITSTRRHLPFRISSVRLVTERCSIIPPADLTLRTGTLEEKLGFDNVASWTC